MINLDSTTIYRAGRTARRLKYENDKVNGIIDGEEGVIRLSFNIKSKGGGITDIQVEIGRPDFEKLIIEYCNIMPKSEALMIRALSNSIALNNKAFESVIETVKKLEIDKTKLKEENYVLKHR